MSDNFYQNRTPEQSFKKLLEEGTQILIDCESPDVAKPKWLDESKYQQGRIAIRKYQMGVEFSCLTGLLLILQLSDALEPLLSTGNSKDIPSLYKRYLSTIMRVKSWHEDDLFDTNGKAYKNIRQVRSLHRRLTQIMNQKNEVLDMTGKPRVWGNQYDFVITQFAFLGLAMLYPHKSGLISAKPQDLEAINYHWRVIGHLIGIRDEFNLCQFDSYDNIKEFNKIIFEREYLAHFDKSPCEKGLKMSQALCLSLKDFIPMVTFNTLAHWWSEYFNFNGYKPKPMTIREQMLLAFYNLSMRHLLKNESILNISNKLAQKRFRRRFKNKDKIFEKIKTKYADQTEYVFFSDRIDYFKKKQDDGGAEEITEISEKSISSCPFGYTSQAAK